MPSTEIETNVELENAALSDKFKTKFKTDVLQPFLKKATASMLSENTRTFIRYMYYEILNKRGLTDSTFHQDIEDLVSEFMKTCIREYAIQAKDTPLMLLWHEAVDDSIHEITASDYLTDYFSRMKIEKLDPYYYSSYGVVWREKDTLQGRVESLEALLKEAPYQSFAAPVKAWTNKFNVVGFCDFRLGHSEEFLNACKYLLRDAKKLVKTSEAYLQAMGTEQPENFMEIQKAYHETVKSYELSVIRVVNNPALSAAVKRNIRNTCLSIAVFVLVAALIAATVATAVVLSGGAVLIPVVLGVAAGLGAIVNSLRSVSTLLDFNDLRRNWGGHSKAKQYHNFSLFGNSIKQTVAEALMARGLAPKPTTP